MLLLPKGKDLIKLVIVAIILFSLYVLYLAIQSSIDRQKPSDEIGKIVPFQTSEKPYCAYTKVSCNPLNTTDCVEKCKDANASEFKCVNLDAHQPSSINANGGGWVCLPSQPTNKCIKENGGANLWTGYGMTNQQGWSCLCTQPLVYNGDGCADKNPSYCSGGTIDPKTLACTCPAKTEKRWRVQSNTPFCVSNDPEKGGGYRGLAGNQLTTPNWGNVRFNLDTNDDYLGWAQRIAYQMNLLGETDVVTKTNPVIDDIRQILKTNAKNQLNNTIIDQICDATNVRSKGIQRNVTNAIKMCASGSGAGKDDYQTAFNYATYTYADQTYKNVE